MSAMSAPMLSAAVTILAIILYMIMAVRVGSMRSKHNVQAPAVTGHPEFERTYRVQVNTLESMPVFLPGLWLATAFFSSRVTVVWWLPAACGALWIIGRYLYMQGYMSDASKRSNGFLLSAIAQIVLLVLAVIGIVMSWSGAVTAATA